ncbi:hypothetical protein NN561_017072 [Cricetulus griseus]
MTAPQHLSSTPTPGHLLFRHPDTGPALQYPASTPTPDWYPDSLQPGIRTPGLHLTARESTAQPAPRHPSAPVHTPADSRIGSPGGVGDVPDEQGGVGGSGVARHAARGPAPSCPPRPLPGRPRSRRRGRGARGLSCSVSIVLATAWAAGEQTHTADPVQETCLTQAAPEEIPGRASKEP